MRIMMSETDLSYSEQKVIDVLEYVISSLKAKSGIEVIIQCKHDIDLTEEKRILSDKISSYELSFDMSRCNDH